MARVAVETHKNERVVLGISGASGVAYGVRALEAFSQLKIESHLVMSKAAEITLGLEMGLTAKAVTAKADYVYGINDIAAAIASGTFKTAGMLVAPCSVRSWSEIATGVTTNLLTRAADVTLKERRPLVLMIRETPLHVGHLRTLAQLAEMGAIILPPLPSFYSEPHTLSDFVDQIVGRALDLLGYDWPGQKRWGETPGNGARRKRTKA
jgi:4-hydroxy-3-polyprenylbenzoate decarboxylase